MHAERRADGERHAARQTLDTRTCAHVLLLTQLWCVGHKPFEATLQELHQSESLPKNTSNIYKPRVQI